MTYGQVYDIQSGGSSGYYASVYLAGSRELALSAGITAEPSDYFRVPTHLTVSPDDHVRVSIDTRGHKWIDEVFADQPGGGSSGSTDTGMWVPVTVNHPGIVTTDGLAVYVPLTTVEGDAIMAKVPS